MPKVSVVMTVYNAAGFLREAVESILNQTFRDFEFIIVDNKSTDASVEILSQFKDPQIKLIKNERNLGQTGALNIGLKASSGNLIARMDADDVSLPERLTKQVNFLEHHPEIALLGTWSVRIDEHGKASRLNRSPTDPLTIKTFSSASGDLTQWCIYHPTVMIRREVLNKIGFYQEPSGDSSAYPQDYELWSRLFLNGYQATVLGEVLLKYRVLETSESRHSPQKIFEHRLNISKAKIRHCCPDFSDQETAVLAHMLEFSLSQDLQSPQQLFTLFDRYFEKFMRQEGNNSRVKILGEKVKFYYLPKLFVRYKSFVFNALLTFIVRHPLFFLDPRFYSKITKIL